MRNTFIQTLTELAASDERIVLLTGDLGYTVLEPFAQQFPTRFYNVGVAEQNLIGIATGLAEAGLIPFAYSIGTFASLRGYEFIRNGPAMHHLPVRVIGVGGGFEYSHAGLTHHSVDDVGVMRVQPAMTVIAPADYAQARAALTATWALPEPIYYRIGKDDKSLVAGLEGRFRLGEAELIGSGADVLLACMGSVTMEAIAAAESLGAHGVSATVAVISTLNPPPNLRDLLARFRYTLSVEDHYINGGLGSLLAEVIAENRLDNQLVRCGLRQGADGITGSLANLRERYGLSAARLTQSVLALLQSNSVR